MTTIPHDSGPARPDRARALLWEGVDELRLEMAVVDVGPEGLRARGTQVGVDPVPYRLTYELSTRPGFETRTLMADAEGAGWGRRLELHRGGDGRWTAEVEAVGEVGLPAGGDTLPDLADAVDCDLGRSPLTNTLPVLRLDLLSGRAAVDLVMAWVSVPDLTVHRSGQRYEPVSVGSDLVVLRYVGRHRSFVGDIVFTPDGFVLDYPELARRVAG